MCRKGLVSTFNKPIAWAIAVLAVSAGAGLSRQAAAAGPHDFNYDPIGQTYTVNGEIVRASEVQRDLAGVLCSKCHPEAVAQLKSSVHFSTQAPNPRILFPGGGAHGMLDRACGLPGSTALINYVSDVTSRSAASATPAATCRSCKALSRRCSPLPGCPARPSRRSAS